MPLENTPPDRDNAGNPVPGPDDWPWQQPQETEPTARADHEPFFVPFARPVSMGGDLTAPLACGAPIPSAVPPTMRWWVALLESLAPLAAAVGGSFFALPLLLLWRPGDDRWFTIAATTAGGVVALATCAGLLKLHNQPLSSIGLTDRSLGLNALIGAGAYVLTIFAMLFLIIAAVIFFPELRERQDDAAEAIKASFPPMGLWSMLLFMAFVAFWEEVAFRGFMLTRLQAIFRRWWLTIPVGAALFGMGHAYQGPVAVAQTMLLGIALGLLFWWRKSLVPGVVFHVLNNALAFLILSA